MVIERKGAEDRPLRLLGLILLASQDPSDTAMGDWPLRARPACTESWQPRQGPWPPPNLTAQQHTVYLLKRWLESMPLEASQGCQSAGRLVKRYASPRPYADCERSPL